MNRNHLYIGIVVFIAIVVALLVMRGGSVSAQEIIDTKEVISTTQPVVIKEAVVLPQQQETPSWVPTALGIVVGISLILTAASALILPKVFKIITQFAQFRAELNEVKTRQDRQSTRTDKLMLEADPTRIKID